MRNILLIAGTRPEAIKIAPIALEAAERDGIKCLIVDTGQHKDLLGPALGAFGLQSQIRLDLKRSTGTLSELASRLFASFEKTFSDHETDAVIVQGDTLSVGVAAQAAFLMQLSVFHVEAGLRSHDLENPFPEEGIRRIISQVATRHYCPTNLARENLLTEGIEDNKILVTGNTIVDSVRLLANTSDKIEFRDIEGLKDLPRETDGFTILVTCHRRENLGDPLRRIMRAIETIHSEIKEAQIIFPLHPNPKVRLFVEERLNHLDRVYLTPPLPYLQMLKIIKNTQVILTDSGGIQEEAPSFGPDLLILRKNTERPEVLNYPLAKLIGTKTDDIVNAVFESFSRRRLGVISKTIVNPFGDGFASKYILDDLEDFFRA
uniref:non-hydrolyzing UDP-N-acetylglucosamine 2-epimerase n=1 Tax=Pararhizobium sp. IMCC3301 TaxID=3067904 RepID=UPI002741AF3F|nr:UDP-N-acetylglucosamine 2-epimerase (non-hydrolyzing) [Pararhizobium sp. IMCC3301]